MMADTPAEAEQMAEPTTAPENAEASKESAEKPAEQSAAPTAEATAAPASKSARPATLDDHFLIDPAAPLPELDTPTAKAYLAEDRREPGRKLFALVCEPGLPVRMEAVDGLRGAFIRGMLPLVTAGPVMWPLHKRKCMALVYERPLGGPALDKNATGLIRISEFDFPSMVIRPLIRAIGELEARGIAHRAIHPNNLYFLDEKREQLVLGSCATAPPGYNQPTIYETIPNGMADPDGRSEGNASDDIYALACTIVFLLVESHPCDRLNDEQILATKIEKGSFSTLCTNTRVPVPLLEALRGMLNDDSSQRWGVREINGWLDGQRQANPQRKPTVKGDLPFEFMRYEHISPRTIAHAFSQNVPEAAQAIRSGEVATWARRLLHNPTLSEAIAAAVEAAKPSGTDVTSRDDFLVSKVCILLDPTAPIHYKGLSFMPESVGLKLVMELLENKNVQRVTEVIMSGLANVWIAAQAGPHNSAKQKYLDKLYTQLRSYLNINEFGFGVERCIYELNSGLPCLSPLLAADYVINLEELLPALDEAANRVDAKRRPVDRHIAAFIATQHNQNIDPHLKATSSPRESTKLIGILSLLALLQWRFKPGPLYGLASWMGGLLGPVINTYHSRTTRREIEREIPRLVRKGNLPDLFDLIDNVEKRQVDNDEFLAAKTEYTEAEHEIREIESNSASLRRQYENKGQQFAATSSLIIAMMIITVLLVVESV